MECRAPCRAPLRYSLAMTHETYGPRTAAWSALADCARALQQGSIKELFEAHPRRFDQFSLRAEGLLLDYSRQLLDARALESLVALAEQTEVPRWIELMFTGHPVNNTEDRPALHVALRRPAGAPLYVYGENVMPLVEAERAKMRALADALHSGELRGFTGKPITDIVNIGIGGSDLGIVMAVQALAEDRLAGLSVHFVSNVDGVALAHVLEAGERRDDVVRDLLEDFHDARDARQRDGRARMAARSRWPGSGCRAMRGGLDQRSRDERVWYRGRPASRDVGLGRRPLLGLVGRRTNRGAGDRLGEVRGVSRRWSCDGRAFPQRAGRAQFAGAARAGRHLEPKFPWRAEPRSAAVRRPPRAFSCLPAAARDGEQREVRAARRRAGRVRDVPRDLGRAGLERAALFLSVAAPGHGARLDRLLAARAVGGRTPGTAGSRCGELPRAGVGARRRRSE